MTEHDHANEDEGKGWRYRGSARPAFATQPGAGQESIWDYPRPPVCVPDTRHVQVRLGKQLIVDTRAGFRILETAGAPTFYLPPDDADWAFLFPSAQRSFCEWKGTARYLHVAAGGATVDNGAWCYLEARGRFATIAGYLAFYAACLDCRVDGEQARPQPGGFYGGWVTNDVVGPFKGAPGTAGW